MHGRELGREPPWPPTTNARLPSGEAVPHDFRPHVPHETREQPSAFRQTAALRQLASLAPGVGDSPQASTVQHQPGFENVGVYGVRPPTPSSRGASKRRYDDLSTADSSAVPAQGDTRRASGVKGVCVSPIDTSLAGYAAPVPRGPPPPYGYPFAAYHSAHFMVPPAHAYAPWAPSLSVSYPTSPAITPRRQVIAVEPRPDGTVMQYALPSLYHSSVPLADAHPQYAFPLPGSVSGPTTRQVDARPPMPGFSPREAPPFAYQHPTQYFSQYPAQGVPMSGGGGSHQSHHRDVRAQSLLPADVALSVPTSIFHPLRSDETVTTHLVESPRDKPSLPSPSGPGSSLIGRSYRCRKCGEMKKGHLCKVAHRTPSPPPE